MPYNMILIIHLLSDFLNLQVVKKVAYFQILDYMSSPESFFMNLTSYLFTPKIFGSDVGGGYLGDKWFEIDTLVTH